MAELQAAKLFLLLATITSCIVAFILAEHGHLSTDAGHYVSVAKNLLSGEGLKTSVIYYEQQLLSGTMPAEQTVFPFGYSLLIAGLMITGMNSLTASIVLACVFFLITPTLIFFVLCAHHVRPVIAACSSSIWFILGILWSYAVAGYTEYLFTFLTLLSIGFISWSNRNETVSYKWIFLGGMLAAAAFAVRYSGVFFLASLGLYLFVWALYKNTRVQWTSLFVALAPGFILAVYIFFRNYHLVGSFSGGPVFAESNTGILLAIRHLYWSIGNIFGFHTTSSIVGIVQLAVLLLVVICIWQVARIVVLGVKQGGLIEGFFRYPFLGISACYVGLVMAVLLVLSSTQEASFLNERYLIPLLPCLLILLTILLNGFYESAGSRLVRKSVKILYLTCGVALASGLLNNIDNEYTELYQDSRYEIIDGALDKKIDGITVGEYLKKEVSNESPIIAPDGQIFYLLLDRPVIGLSRRKYFDVQWTDQRVKSVVEKYNVKHVVLFPGLFDREAPENSNRLFYQSINSGDIPVWLTQVVREDDIWLFRVH